MTETPRARRAKRSDARFLRQLIGSDRTPLVAGSWIAVASSLMLIAELAFIALALSTVIENFSISPAYPFLIVIVMLALTRIAADSVALTLGNEASERIKERIRSRITAAIAGISPIDRNKPHAGELAAVSVSHVEAVGPYLTRYQPAKLRSAVVPLVILVLTAYFSWVAALVLIVTGPLIPVFMALIGSEARAASEKQLRQTGSMNGVLLDRLQGLRTLRLFDANSRAAEEIRSEGETIRQKTMAVLRIAFLSSVVLELFAALGIAFVAVYVGFSFLGNVSFGAYGELSLFGGLLVLMIAPEFFRPLRDFASAYHDQAAAHAASREITKLLYGNWIKLPVKRQKIDHLETLSAEAVSVRLGEKVVLPVLSLAIRRGERVALIGSSGSGKSVLLALLGGLIAPSTGLIKVNGSDRAQVEVAWLGQKTGFFQGSLASNLTMGRSDIGRHDVEVAARLANADEIAAKLERGYDELLRENGANVSGGEAQRLAIARLALSNADLILADEPTEHLDATTAEAIIEGLFRLAENRTLIVATHDKEVISRADRVIDVRKLRHEHQLQDAA